MAEGADLPDAATQDAPLVRLSDVLALIDTVAAEPGSRTKVWIAEPSVTRLKDRVRALPQQAPAAPATVHGLDAQAWFDTARRYHAGLRTIAYTWGAAIDHQWARDQARWYLGDQAGRQAWAMPDAPDLVQIVVPRSGPPEQRIVPPPPVVTLKPGETAVLEFNKPAVEPGGLARTAASNDAADKPDANA